MGELMRRRHRLYIVCIIAAIAFLAVWDADSGRALASGPYTLEPRQEVIGEPGLAYAQENDTLLDIALDFDLGYNAIAAANPGVDPWVPAPWQKVVLPSEWILPSAAHEGIVLNLAEMRLYYFYRSNGSDMVVTFPIGVGKDGFDTLLGEHRVVGKEKNPVWHPTAASKMERPELPDAVPPGPDNPLGGYKLALNIPGYLLHGTNRPYGVGRRVSHGCIRLFPEDIAWLFDMVKEGTRVEVIYQPVKAALVDGRLMVEVHDDYLHGADLMKLAMDEIRRAGYSGLRYSAAVEKAVEEKKGVPVDVTPDFTPE